LDARDHCRANRLAFAAQFFLANHKSESAMSVSMNSVEHAQQLILDCMKRLNEQRERHEQLDVAPDAKIFGDGSPLDSMGLVTLMMDIEDALADEGIEVSLSDERAMSRKRSPYRDVPALVAFIEEQRGEAGAE
jgi:acyl carrier protein